MEQTEIERLTKIAYRSESIFDKAHEYLKSFWNPDMSCFHTNEKAKADKTPSMTNTSFALFAILESEELRHTFQKKARKKGVEFFLSVAKTLLEKDWNSEKLGLNNIYTTPIVLVALYRLIAETTEGAAIDGLISNGYTDKVKKGVNRICRIIETKKAAVYNGYEPSAYLTYWSYRALRYASEDNSLGDRIKKRCEKCVEAVASWGKSEFLAQLAYKSACDLASFDATQLAYALMIYIENTGKSGLRANKRIIKKAINSFLCEQLDDGLWPEGHPIFHIAERGSVYTFTFEVLAVLLSKPKDIRSLLEPKCIERFEASLDWVEFNEITTHEMKGWRSNHLPFGDGAEAWSTAAVLVSMRKIKELVEMYLHNTVCSEYHAVIHESPGETFLESKDYYDSDLTYMGENHSLKETIEKYLIKSHLSGLPDDSDRKNSAVFFGPPGTGKTTVAKSIAEGLGWPYIELQTSDFTGEGVDKITGNARRIFRELGLLNKAVVLFDEVEEFVRDRSEKSLPPHSRMITTTMLSLIQELYKKKKVIFIVATNYLMKFDDAITRAGGRFDMLLLIAPPSLKEKAKMFCEIAETEWGADAAATTTLSGIITEFVTDNKKPVEYYNFHEWKAFTAEVLKKSANYSDITINVLRQVLSDTEKKIILAVRDDNSTYNDYEKSKERVRI